MHDLAPLTTLRVNVFCQITLKPNFQFSLERNYGIMKLTNMIAITLTAILATYSNASAQITTPVRQIQIRNIDFANQTVEIHNFGTADQDLSGWRFCTHDESEVRRYSDTVGFSGVTLSLIHI